MSQWRRRAGGPPRGIPAAWTGGGSFLLALLPPLLAGGLLRVWGLAGQVVLGDELHPVRNVVLHDLGTILVSYRVADPSIPLTALLEVATLAGLPLTELLLRLPALLAGLVTVVVLPRVVLPAVGPRRAVLFAWLLALSPSLVFYSRIGRPYAIVVLLGFCALAAFWRFWNGGRAAWGALYALTGSVAAWFHLVAAPLVAAPLAWAGAEWGLARVRGRAPGARGLASLAAAGAGLALGLAAFLGPSWESFQTVIHRKVAEGRPGAGTLAGVLVLQAGTPFPGLVAAFWGVALLGLVVFLRRRRRLALFGSTAVFLQGLAVVAIFQPTALERVVVAERYALVFLPIVLLAVSAGLDRLWQAGPGRRARRWVARGAGVAVAGGLVLGHPYLLDPALRLGPWAGSLTARLYGAGVPPPALPEEHVSSAYRAVVSTPGEGAVVEVPSYPASWATRAQLALWRLHGRPVVLASAEGWLQAPEARRLLRFDTLVAARPEALRPDGARFVLLHRDRPRLVRIERSFTQGEGPVVDRPSAPAHATVQVSRSLARELSELWGEPHLTDGHVLLWDLARPRERGGGSIGISGAFRESYRTPVAAAGENVLPRRAPEGVPRRTDGPEIETQLHPPAGVP